MITENRLNQDINFRPRQHTLDQLNFVCIPLNVEEVNAKKIRRKQNKPAIDRFDSKKFPSQTNLSATNLDENLVCSSNRRVRFKLDDEENFISLRNVRSTEDLRIVETAPVHRVKFEISIQPNR